MKSNSLKQKIYEGSSKIVYQLEDEYLLIQFFKDGLKAPNGEVIQIPGKGVVNNTISAFIMEKLGTIGIDNHLVKKLNMREQLVKAAHVFPVQVLIANIACGRYVKDFGIEEGCVFDSPMVDFRMRNGSYPVINEDQILNFNWMSLDEIKLLKSRACRINDFLAGMFSVVGLRLVECRLEFGRAIDADGEVVMMLVDEVTPDTCSLWDTETNQRFDYESIVTSANAMGIYQEIAHRLCSLRQEQ